MKRKGKWKVALGSDIGEGKMESGIGINFLPFAMDLIDQSD